jgi:hypothetical protein
MYRLVNVSVNPAWRSGAPETEPEPSDAESGARDELIRIFFQGLAAFGLRTLPSLLVSSGLNHRLSLPERERVRLGAGLEERDLHRPLAHPVVLAYELVHASVLEHAVPVLVDVHAT